MPIFRLVVRLLLLFLAAPSMAASEGSGAPSAANLPSRVVAFTNEAFPLTGAEALRARGVEVHVFNLDEVQSLEQEIDARLPGNEAQAKAEAKRIIGQYQERLIGGWRGIAQAVKWGIHSLPAVVINDEAVIYGETDLGRATTRWRENQG